MVGEGEVAGGEDGCCGKGAEGRGVGVEVPGGGYEEGAGQGWEGVELGVWADEGWGFAGDDVAEEAAAGCGGDAEGGCGEWGEAVFEGFDGAGDGEEAEAGGVEQEEGAGEVVELVVGDER